MAIRIFIIVAVFVTSLLIPDWARAQADTNPVTAPNPLAPFERLIGGQWYLDRSYQEFEWGVGRRAVRARSYFLIEDTPKLVSEGIWFWHPEEQRIKGIFTAIDMPVEIFEYTARFEGNSLVSELVAYAADGAESQYVEKWEFVDETHFVWTLFTETANGLEEEMGGTYARRH